MNGINKGLIIFLLELKVEFFQLNVDLIDLIKLLAVLWIFLFNHLECVSLLHKCIQVSVTRLQCLVGSNQPIFDGFVSAFEEFRQETLQPLDQVFRTWEYFLSELICVYSE